MKEIIQKIQNAMNIVSGINARVDQVNTVTLPLVNVVNTLADVRDALQEMEKERCVCAKAEAIGDGEGGSSHAATVP